MGESATSCSQSVGIELCDQVKSLLQDAMDGYDDTFGFGSMSCAVYDTAWVSLVARTIDGKRQWLFPNCFHYLLDHQGKDGGWGITEEQTDGILSTAAALLSLIRHQTEPLNLENISHNDLKIRIRKGTDSLRSQLQDWAVASAVHVGFEVIIPALLQFLSCESLEFSFEGMEKLMKIHEEKLSKFHPDLLYGSRRSAALHSLEAFIGKIDFDRISHHTTLGSMMGSPSSTAAYLMNVTVWDHDAEAYLRHVVDHAAGRGNGGVPSAYPSTIFEYSWVCTTTPPLTVSYSYLVFRFCLHFSPLVSQLLILMALA